MKDTIITGKQKKFELYYILSAFLFAFLLNVFSIIKFKHPAIELLSQIFVVILVAIFIYFILIVLRLVWWLLAKFYKKIVKN